MTFEQNRSNEVKNSQYTTQLASL